MTCNVPDDLNSLSTVAMALFLSALSGCMEAPQPSGPKKPPTTDKIGEFEPNAGQEVVKPRAEVTDPVTGPLQILRAAQIQLPSLQIEHALNLFNASEGYYPRTHEEFMSRIIEENKLRLPQLSADLEYQYDVANHKLVIVRIADENVVK